MTGALIALRLLKLGTIVVVVPDVPGIEYRLHDARLHYKIADQRLHYRLHDARLHVQANEE